MEQDLTLLVSPPCRAGSAAHGRTPGACAAGAAARSADLEAARQVANTLAELIIGGTLAAVLLGTKPEDADEPDEDGTGDDQDDENPAA